MSCSAPGPPREAAGDEVRVGGDRTLGRALPRTLMSVPIPELPEACGCPLPPVAGSRWFGDSDDAVQANRSRRFANVHTSIRSSAMGEDPGAGGLDAFEL